MEYPIEKIFPLCFIRYLPTLRDWAYPRFLSIGGLSRGNNYFLTAHLIQILATSHQSTLPFATRFRPEGTNKSSTNCSFPISGVGISLYIEFCNFHTIPSRRKAPCHNPPFIHSKSACALELRRLTSGNLKQFLRRLCNAKSDIHPEKIWTPPQAPKHRLQGPAHFNERALWRQHQP
ncbi:MAG: hypothetical protein A4E58_00935 [Syntrophorhabdus sp. PtaB.Bin006]|nr:MAG: hypothetical protein A4E58_00935 [Syntrophorhabdus sp. PtaB.Bin006]